MTDEKRAEVIFIHMNHTNPCLDESSAAYREVRERGYHIAKFGDSFTL